MQIILDGKYMAQRSVVALGMFDGVHLGHRVLLERGAYLAREKGVPLVVSTFQEHPLQVIAPDQCPPQLTTFEERSRLMEELGVDVLYAMPFNTEVMSMPPEDYVGHLVRQFHPTDVVCGYNHTFGRKGEGKPALLQFLGDALGFATSIVPKITLEGAEVSSTAIRAHLNRGAVEQARRLLDRPYELTVVKEGDQWHILPQGKQALPQGTYRALCLANGKRLPVVVKLLKNGQVRCRMPDGVKEAQLAFLIQLSLDF